mmetsp:Transcript_51927/g.151276  ORF Transcript_51927/g.151276 Transcript_51927/m.151276 type:complete len:327 (+) Transcript_51927:1675-2655(+)
MLCPANIVINGGVRKVLKANSSLTNNNSWACSSLDGGIMLAAQCPELILTAVLTFNATSIESPSQSNCVPNTVPNAPEPRKSSGAKYCIQRSGTSARRNKLMALCSAGEGGGCLICEAPAAAAKAASEDAGADGPTVGVAAMIACAACAATWANGSAAESNSAKFSHCGACASNSASLAAPGRLACKSSSFASSRMSAKRAVCVDLETGICAVDTRISASPVDGDDACATAPAPAPACRRSTRGSRLSRAFSPMPKSSFFLLCRAMDGGAGAVATNSSDIDKDEATMPTLFAAATCHPFCPAISSRSISSNLRSLSSWRKPTMSEK